GHKDLWRDGHVCRWEAQLPPAAVAGLNPASDLVRTPEQPSSRRDIALRQRSTNRGGRHRLVKARHDDQPDGHDVKAEIDTEAAQQGNVATTLAPEMEVFADYHRSGAEAADQHLVHEVFGTLAGARFVEVHDDDVVE